MTGAVLVDLCRMGSMGKEQGRWFTQGRSYKVSGGAQGG